MPNDNQHGHLCSAPADIWPALCEPSLRAPLRSRQLANNKHQHETTNNRNHHVLWHNCLYSKLAPANTPHSVHFFINTYRRPHSHKCSHFPRSVLEIHRHGLGPSSDRNTTEWPPLVLYTTTVNTAQLPQTHLPPSPQHQLAVFIRIIHPSSSARTTSYHTHTSSSLSIALNGLKRSIAIL